MLMLKLQRRERQDKEQLPWRTAPPALEVHCHGIRMDAMTVDPQGPESGRSQAPQETTQPGVLHRRQKVNISETSALPAAQQQEEGRRRAILPMASETQL